MRLMGQRWRYEIGNNVVNVDNAFSWQLWGQERLVVNDEIACSQGAWLSFRRHFTEPWLTLLGDDELKVLLHSSVHGIHCDVTLAGEKVIPSGIFGASWQGPTGTWPDAACWVTRKDDNIAGWAG